MAALAVVFYSGMALAQVCPADRYCYYVPPIAPSASPSLELTAPHGDASVRVSVNGGALAAAITVTDTVTTQAEANLVAAAYGTVGTRGGYIVSDLPLVVAVRDAALTFNDRVTIKASRMALGRRFRVMGYPLNGIGASSNQGFDTVAIFAPTGATVTITPPGGVTFADSFTGTTVLTGGQSTIVRSVPGGDLTGATIVSDKPIAVTTGGRGVSPDDTCFDAGFDNIVPTNHGGTHFMLYDSDGVSVPAQNQFYVIADTAATVSINGGAGQAIAAGGVLVSSFTATTTDITSTAPVHVYQVAASGGTCDYGLAAVPPVSFATSVTNPTSVGFTTSIAGEVAVLLPGNVDGSALFLDGDNTALALEPPFTSGGPYFAHANVAQGFHALRASHDFQVLVAVGTAVGTGSQLDYLFPYRLDNCGNNTTDAGESCDDGNVFDFDVCSTTCKFEDGQGTCTDNTICAEGTVCHPGTNTCANDCHTFTCDPATAECAEAFCDDTTSVCGARGVAAGTTCSTGVCAGPSNPSCVECVTNANCVSAEGPGATCAAGNNCVIAAPTVDSPIDESTINDRRPVYSGTGPAGASLQVFVDTVSIGTTTVNGTTGAWSLAQPTDLSYASHQVYARVTAGTLSATSSTVDFDVIAGCVDASDCSSATPICAASGACVQCEDTGDCTVTGTTCVDNVCALPAPIVVAPADGSTTNATRPEISGTAGVNLTVSVILDNVAIGTTVANGSGNWTFTPSGDLNRGAHTVRARTTAGAVQSPLSATNTFTIIDNCSASSDCPVGATCNGSFACVVAAPVVSTPANGSTINDPQPTYSGTGPVGTTISVMIDAASVGTTTVGSGGTWSLDATSTLGLGAHNLQATATAGTIVSSLSNTNTFTLISGCLIDADCGAGSVCGAQHVCSEVPGGGGDGNGDGNEAPGEGSPVAGGGVSCVAAPGGELGMLFVVVTLMAFRRRRS